MIIGQFFVQTWVTSSTTTIASAKVGSMYIHVLNIKGGAS